MFVYVGGLICVFSRIKCTKRYFVINSSIVCRRRLKTKNIYHYQPNKWLMVSSSLMSVLKRVFQDDKHLF